MYGMIILLIVGAVILGVGILILCLCKNEEKEMTENEIGGVAVIALGIFLIMLFGMISVAVPLKSKKEYLEFENTREIVEQAYANGSYTDNVAVTETIIEENEWLASAKASKETYGIFSSYYYIDIEEIEMITIYATEE